MKLNLTKKLESTSFKRLFVFFMTLLVLICLIYVIANSYNLISNNQNAFSSYGSFISGIAGLLNVIVFIFLTIHVAQLGDKNSNAQIEAQRKIMLAQFRQSELNKLNEFIEELLGATEDDKPNPSNNQVMHFLNNNQYLFPIIVTDVRINDNIMNLINVTQYHIILLTNKNSSMDKGTKFNKLSGCRISIQEFKNALNHELQKFIIDELK